MKADFFSAFSLGCSDKTICSSLHSVTFTILFNSLFMYYVNLKMLSHIDVIIYLHLLLTLYYLLFIYTTYLGCIMIIMCMCRSSQKEIVRIYFFSSEKDTE